ncbi:MAG: histidine phosphatase family protein [Chloroflexi bacterium]|nr:histidine phosphatase family protein [Chloroflexota bacterium]
MKSLLLLRHAKSSWKDMSLGDHDRPLNPRGKRDAPRMGRLLHELDLVPDAILSSTAKRAFKTAQAVAEAAGYEGEIEKHRSLYHAGADVFIEMLRTLPDEVERAMLVGHNPGMEYAVLYFTGEDERYPTATVAHIQLPIDSWAELDEETEGKLLGLWRPKELD